MDAVRLIKATGGALAASEDASDVMVESWQAQALAQAVGSRLAVTGPSELRGEALGLSEIGGRGCSALHIPSLGPDGIRAARLTGIADTHVTLHALADLLGEVGIALVGIASAAEDQGAYWQCMEAIDAADECRDRVLEMIRRLPPPDRTLPGRDLGAQRW
ncbi:DUF6099 family protein [Streptomyces uncialis]|uniref:DUF6099 family protein n=1 Tax=Streptomyces uncialis TaxID=1048205 RepID=UPI0033F0E246